MAVNDFLINYCHLIWSLTKNYDWRCDPSPLTWGGTNHIFFSRFRTLPGPSFLNAVTPFKLTSSKINHFAVELKEKVLQWCQNQRSNIRASNLCFRCLISTRLRVNLLYSSRCRYWPCEEQLEISETKYFTIEFNADTCITATFRNQIINDIDFVLDHGKDLKRGLNGIAVEAIHESFTPRSVQMR